MTKIVAHRGASSEVPENSLAAFDRAIEVGADMIEFDVRRALDGTLVVSHDPMRGRECPTLEDTLHFTQGRIQLDVELKEPGCERDAIRLLLEHHPLEGFCITSFLPGSLSAIRAIDPRIRTGIIFSSWNAKVREECLSQDSDFLVAHYRSVDQAAQIGKPLFVWTVDDPVLTRALFERALVEAVVTNDPRQAVALRYASREYES